MIQSTDQTGHKITLKGPPQKIISLVPSQTELLYNLGLDKETIGITRFCIHPESWYRTKTRIGGTKDLHLDQIRNLQPDLVIANKEENTREQVEEITQILSGLDKRYRKSQRCPRNDQGNRTVLPVKMNQQTGWHLPLKQI